MSHPFLAQMVQVTSNTLCSPSCPSVSQHVKASKGTRCLLIRHRRKWLHLRSKLAMVTNKDLDVNTLNDDDSDTTDVENDVDDSDEIECGCCFATHPFRKMVPCPEGHLFCKTCITTYASVSLGDNNPDIHCMDESGCKLGFHRRELKLILPAKMMDLYERMEQQKEIMDAGLEGLEDCPFCEWKCVIEDSNSKVFRCGNQENECGIVSCRECKKKDHGQISCRKFMEEEKLKGRHFVEEAMTQALIRQCPKCHKAFVKVQNDCNKMKCPSCGALSCYLCRKAILNYDHFSAITCPLYSSADTEIIHAQEVKQAELEALATYKRQNPQLNERHLSTDARGSPVHSTSKINSRLPILHPNIPEPDEEPEEEPEEELQVPQTVLPEIPAVIVPLLQEIDAWMQWGGQAFRGVVEQAEYVRRQWEAAVESEALEQFL